MTLLSPTEAAREILAGRVIGTPTEGVYGLSCDPWNEAAVHALLKMKQRDVAKGLIILAGDLYQLTSLVRHLSRQDQDTLASSWPGPVTWLIPAPADAPEWITGGQPTLALRVTDHPEVAALTRMAGKAIVSTSANPAGEPAARDADTVRHYFPDLAILEGSLGGLQGPTEIRQLADGRVIRPGSN